MGLVLRTKSPTTPAGKTAGLAMVQYQNRHWGHVRNDVQDNL